MWKIKRLLKKWQKRLYLRDWNIAVERVAPHEMLSNTSVAEIQYQIESQDALIRICHPNPCVDKSVKQDIEESIVHELLHLHFTALQHYIEPGSTDHRLHEIAINQLVKALLRRKK